MVAHDGFFDDFDFGLVDDDGGGWSGVDVDDDWGWRRLSRGGSESWCWCWRRGGRRWRGDAGFFAALFADVAGGGAGG